MAKNSRTNDIRNNITGEGQRVNQEHNNFMNMIMGQINDPTGGPSGATRDETASGFRGVLNRGPSKYDPMFMNAARGGLITDENRERIRGKGNFDEFARTGGYNEGDLANIRSRSNRSIPSFFEGLKNKFKTQGTIQGQGPSYNSSLSRIARDQSRQAGEQAVDTEIGIKDKVNEGRRWGTEGLSGAETNLANLESTNKRFGIGGGAANEVANRGIDLDALRGLFSVGESGSQEKFKLYDMLLSAMGQRGSLSGNNVNTRASYDPRGDFMDRFLRIYGTIAGIIPGSSSGNAVE